MPAPNQKAAPPLTIGGVVADKYRIEALLGEGGMGFVFAALHLQLGHRVALKVLQSASISDREVTERFLREGRALARLQGEHIARVSDVGTLTSGEPYMVMEFLEGRDLARELAARGPLPLVEAVEFIAQACEALAEAHVRGIVHRDLKPANLFLAQRLDGEPLIKVLDFGISKVSPDAGDAIDMDNNITVTSSLVGTPKYMSPEQIQDSRAVDSRTDIWGLGTILYELLTKSRPFAAPSLALVCVKVLHEEVPPPSSLRPDIPPGVDEIIARCLKKQPGDRFANVGELVEALAPFGNPSVRASATRITRILAARASGARLGADSSGSLPGVRAPSLISADSSQPVPRTPSAVRIVEKENENETLTAATLLETTAKSTRRKQLIAVGGGAVLLVVGVILFFAFRSPTKSETTTTIASAEARPVATPEPSATQVAVQPSATATASAIASATASAKPKWVPHAGGHHTTTQPTATTQGTGDVLEDRR